MCGRFTLHQDLVSFEFGIDPSESFEYRPSYNIAPSHDVVVVRNDVERQFSYAQWGLIPSWAKDASFGMKTINARSETIHEKPAFRSSFSSKRCLIPADGFYEWQKVTGQKHKVPHFIHLADKKTFAFAGLWEVWNDITSCTIITCPANDKLQPIHHRMPVILPQSAYDLWLSPDKVEKDSLLDLLQPLPDGLVSYYPISTQVNKVGFNDPDVLEPLNPFSQESLF